MVKKLLVLLLLSIPAPLYAGYVINSQGTAGAPVVVSNTPVTILAQNTGRYGYWIIPETVNIRCSFSPDSSAPSPTPSSTVGFLLLNGIYFGYAPREFQVFPLRGRVDCVSTGAATNVSTIEVNQ